MLSFSRRLHQMAVSSSSISSKLDDGGASSLSSSSSAVTFSWNHHHYNALEDHWTTTPTTTHDDNTDNASTMMMFPFCVNNIIDYQQQLHYASSSPQDDGGCPVMIWKILRFIKLIVIRLAHSYAQRVILFVLPLLLGLLVGFLWGRRCCLNNNNNNQSKTSSSSFPYFTTSTSFWHVVMPVVNSFFRMLLKFQQPESTSESVHAAAEATMNQSKNGVKEAEESSKIRSSNSGLDKDSIPRHVAIIMDGNRRYGRAKYQNATRGHRDGANQVLQVAKWCIAEEHIQVLTLYAFSTENWNRDPAEIAAIMNMFVEECENVRREAIQLNVRAYVVSSDPTLIPTHVALGLQRLQADTAHCTGLQLNICVSYGSRSEIVHACRQVVHDVQNGTLSQLQISEETFARRLLTSHQQKKNHDDDDDDNSIIVDPDILIRTSGETRISNYLLWQIAYAELFFVPQTWPELQHADFTNILHCYAKERQRRFGR